MCDGEAVGIVVTAVLLLVLVFGMGMLVGGEISVSEEGISISHETADKICFDLTGEEGVAAKDWWDFDREKEPIGKGELYCQVPSYDSTQLIKVGK